MSRLSALGVLVILVLLISASVALAQSHSDTDAMASANQLYESGEFPESVAAYQQLVDRGRRNAELHYNLGSAYFKIGDLGRAVLNYRRAALLAPRDPDVRANLDIARGLTADQIDRGTEAAVARLLGVAQRFLTLNEAAIVSLALWSLLAGLVVSYVFIAPGRARRSVAYVASGVAVLLVLGLFSLGSRLYLQATYEDAVVVAGEVDVVSGPGTQYVTEFTLHTGSEVRVLEERGSWTRLSLPGGQLQGWVPAGDVEQVAID